MSFLFQTILMIGLPLVALPLLIHLINLRRHRRIDWAAMEFLLESQKRNKKWIRLKQLLLLLLRTAAVATIVFMLAGPVISGGWAGLFGRGLTHHVVLLDDSYSMSDRWEETSAFDQAKRAVLQIVTQARGRTDNQLVTLVRFSEAKGLAAGARSQFDRRTLDAAFVAELERRLGEMAPSESNAGPVEALQAALRMPEPTADETRIAYLVSDFRRPQWEERAQLRQLAGQLRERTEKLLLVGCAYDERPNLAITRLAPESGIRGAGVETWMELGVKNFGDAPATAVTAAVEQDGARLPSVEIDEILPGEEVSRRFRVTFPAAGAHQLEAHLESDAVETDNSRYFAADIPAAFPVLAIDSSAEGDDGYFLRNALSPGGRNLGGWSPQVEPVSFLRQHERLGDFAVICLLDVPRLDEAEVEALENYVKSGGGLAVFPGPQSQRPFYNERLYVDGEGLLPTPLGVPTQLAANAAAGTPDVQVTDHPVFRVFAGQRNSFLAVAKVNFYFAVDPEWTPPETGDVRVLARLRNKAPFAVEKKFGDGRVMLQLCKLSPKSTELGSWSNWSLNPVFPVFANELVGYLSAARRRFDVRTVGEPVRITAAEADYQPEVRVRAPGSAESQTVAPAAKDGQYAIEAGGLARSGVWEFQLTTRDGKSETRYAAVNVPAGEGDLHLVSEEQLAERLRGVDYDFAPASEFSDADDQLTGFRIADALLYGLIGLLVAEQLMAVSASYHPRAERRAA